MNTYIKNFFLFCTLTLIVVIWFGSASQKKLGAMQRQNTCNDSRIEKKEYIVLIPGTEIGAAPLFSRSMPAHEKDKGLNTIKLDLKVKGVWRVLKKIQDKKYHLYEIPEGNLTTEIGSPTIPFYSAEVEIPFQAKFKEISIHADLKKKCTNVLLPPQQEPLPVNPYVIDKNKFIIEKPKFILNSAVYNKTSQYPGHYYDLISDSFLGDKHILIIHLFPVQYLPAHKEIRIYDLHMDVFF